MINTEMLQQERKNTGIGLPFLDVQFTNWVIFVIYYFFIFLGGGWRFLIRKVSVN